MVSVLLVDSDLCEMMEVMLHPIIGEATAFKRYVETQNKLDPIVACGVDASVGIAAVTEGVEVVASVAEVQSETARFGRVVESTQFRAMVLNGRKLLEPALATWGIMDVLPPGRV